MSSTPAAVTHLVSFLTRPLMRAHAPATILALQRHLHAAFSDLSAGNKHIDFLLSAHCPPPPTLQIACLVSGIRWAEWIRLLSANLDLRITLTHTELVVKLGERRLVRAAVPVTASTSVASRPRSAALNPTRVPTSLSSCYSASDDDDDDDSASECDSDVDSDSVYSAASSATSASGTSMEDVRVKPLPLPTTPAQRYVYAGGVTQVLSGRVMLGPAPACAAPVPAPAPKLRLPSARPALALRATVVQRKTAPSADTAASWRRAL